MDWKPNPHTCSTLGMVPTRVLEVEGKGIYHYVQMCKDTNVAIDHAKIRTHHLWILALESIVLDHSDTTLHNPTQVALHHFFKMFLSFLHPILQGLQITTGMLEEMGRKFCEGLLRLITRRSSERSASDKSQSSLSSGKIYPGVLESSMEKDSDEYGRWEILMYS